MSEAKQETPVVASEPQKNTNQGKGKQNANQGKGNKGGQNANQGGKGKQGGQNNKAKPKPTTDQVKVSLNDFPVPDFVEQRLKLWDQIKKENANQKHEEQPIQITLPDGSNKEAISWKTTPMDIAKGISQGLAQNVIAAKVNDIMWDLNRPFEGSSTLSLLKFDDPDAKHVFWHSSAHIMGQALERKYQAALCVGPALPAGGFYYDMAIPEKEGAKTTVEAGDYTIIEQLVAQIANEKQVFERLEISKEQALELFKYNKYKTELIKDKVPDGANCTAYRCGTLVDLCKGPHLPHTGKASTFGVWKNASAYWKGNAENDSLQRVYGMSFPSKDQFAEWKASIEAARARDHRLQGKTQELYFFHPMSPGCPFFLPRGAKLYNKLLNFIRDEYRKRGFTEVLTPNMFNKDLWIKSGHWKYYADAMFTCKVEGQDFALKPMNCPSHCLMYQYDRRSYRDLPIRYADFGVLHRNELSGALTGLTRVRKFCQDDAHIFCRPDQITQEITGCFDFLKYVYGVFGFKFGLELSTRPEKKYIGEIETWNSAEEQLRLALNAFVGQDGWKLNPGDGAFYGPKIDIQVFDAIGRSHQCATIQLDFNLPSQGNFDLTYSNVEGGDGRVVMIHRAIFGSIERFMAILVENTAGKWPFWLSPRPMIITPVKNIFHDYALSVQKALFEAGFEAELDFSDHTFARKIADAEVANYNYILVVGQKEMEGGTVNLRDGLDKAAPQTPLSIADVIHKFKQLTAEFK